MSNLHNLATRTIDYSKTTLNAGAFTATIICNAIKGQIVRTAIASAAPSSALTGVDFTVTNNRVGPDSVIVINPSVSTGVATFIGKITVTNGQFVFSVIPLTSATLTAYTFDFYVLNPVCSK